MTASGRPLVGIRRVSAPSAHIGRTHEFYPGLLGTGHDRGYRVAGARLEPLQRVSA